MDLLGVWRESFGRNAPEDLYSALLDAWSGPNRHYHGPTHLRAGLAALANAPVARPDRVAIAWWFHDAVLVPGAADNEAASAQWAARALSAFGVDASDVAWVVRAIEGTRAHRDPVDGDAAVLFDVDLSILAASAADYATYVAGVRAEYAFVPEPAWRLGRRAFVAGMLARAYIYHTPAYRQREGFARENLERELRSLAD